MDVLTSKEAFVWAEAHNISTNEYGRLLDKQSRNFQSACFDIPKIASKHFWFSRLVENSLRPWTNCLFWLNAWGIWESSENWNLFYRLRQSYGDYRTIEQAPAHLFSEEEGPDLINFIQIGISAGWDICLLTNEDSSRVILSHDEWAKIMMKDKKEFKEICERVKGRSLLKEIIKGDQSSLKNNEKE